MLDFISIVPRLLVSTISVTILFSQLFKLYNFYVLFMVINCIVINTSEFVAPAAASAISVSE